MQTISPTPTGNAGSVNDCKELCRTCQITCQETLTGHCLEMGGEHVEKEHVKLMLDCIDICGTAAGFMDRGSSYHSYVCGACAEICEACADSCAALEGDTMKACADICRQCAAACSAMAQGNR